jgi:hypothetical protein
MFLPSFCFCRYRSGSKCRTEGRSALVFVEYAHGVGLARGDSRHSTWWGACSRVTRVNIIATAQWFPPPRRLRATNASSASSVYSSAEAALPVAEASRKLRTHCAFDSPNRQPTLLSFSCDSRLSIRRSLNDCIVMLVPTDNKGRRWWSRRTCRQPRFLQSDWRVSGCLVKR